jgi:hypothetical protein
VLLVLLVLRAPLGHLAASGQQALQVVTHHQGSMASAALGGFLARRGAME